MEPSTIALIGGPARCGKSTLARRLSQDFSVPVAATDHLISALQLGAPEYGIGFGLEFSLARLPQFLTGYAMSAGGWGERNAIVEGVGFDAFTVEGLAAAIAGTLTIVQCYLVHTAAEPADLTIGGGWLAAPEMDEMRDTFTAMIRADSELHVQACAAKNAPFFDIADGWDQAMDGAYGYLEQALRTADNRG